MMGNLSIADGFAAIARRGTTAPIVKSSAIVARTVRIRADVSSTLRVEFPVERSRLAFTLKGEASRLRSDNFLEPGAGKMRADT